MKQVQTPKKKKKEYFTSRSTRTMAKRSIFKRVDNTPSPEFHPAPYTRLLLLIIRSLLAKTPLH
jgi:hypothetical protein